MGNSDPRFFFEAWYSLEYPGRFDFESPTGGFDLNLPPGDSTFEKSHATSRESYTRRLNVNNEKWWEHTRVYGFSTMFLKWFHWIFYKNGC